MYRILYSPLARKDSKKIEESHLKLKCLELLNIIAINPYQNPPPYEKLIGDLKGFLSRRINIQHRMVYKVCEKERIIKLYRMWSHYD